MTARKRTTIRIAKYEYGCITVGEVQALEVSGVWAYDDRCVVTHVPTGCQAYAGRTLAQTRRVFRQLAQDLPTWGARAKWKGRGLKGRTRPMTEAIKRADPQYQGLVPV